MRTQLFYVLVKDIKEFLRMKKNIVFIFSLVFLCATVMLSTKALPLLIEELSNKALAFISDSQNLSDVIVTFFPTTLAANMGILSSDIAIIYGLIVILSTYNVVVKEIDENKWIFPLGAGYNPSILLISKGLIYGMGAAFPSIIIYLLYYVIASTQLYNDYLLNVAIFNSLVLGYSIFMIVYISIMLTIIYKRHIMSVITMFLYVGVAPDIFSIFSFGKYLPTYLLTHIYNSSSDVCDVIIPAVSIFIVLVIITYVASKRIRKVQIVR